jgi:ribosome biogenesis GTPase
MKEGRIIEVHRTNFIVKSDDNEYTATVRGAFHDEGEFPKVGDYVSYTLLNDGGAVIEMIRPRTSVIKRKSVATDEEQIMVANVNLIIIVMGLDGDYNMSRLERYLLLAKQSDIPAVIVLNKTDTTTRFEEQLQEVEAVAGPIRVIATSAISGEGMIVIKECFTPETTAVLLGSSGAGKSTIANWLLGADVQVVADTRFDDGKGRHTTTSRQLFELPFGGYLIDTPGMRELGVMEDEHTAEMGAFQKIEALATGCKFRNCDHEKSAGCAVLEALESGELSEREFQNYQKIVAEREFLASKDSTNSARHEAQNQKREQQKNEAARRARLSRGK